MAAISARSLRSLARISSSLGKTSSGSVKTALQSRGLSSAVARSLVNESSLLKSVAKNSFAKMAGKHQLRVVPAAISIIINSLLDDNVENAGSGDELCSDSEDDEKLRIIHLVRYPSFSLIPHLELVGCGCDAESLEGVSEDDDTFSGDDDAIHRRH